MGVIPAVLAVLVLLAFVRETGKKSAKVTALRSEPVAGQSKVSLGTKFKLFLVILAVFTLGKSSDFFLILRGQNLGAPLFQVTLMLVVFNAVYVAVSIPAGILSDKLRRTGVIALGWFIYALVYLGFALVSSLWQVWLLFALYGVYYGLTEGVARAYVADLVPVARRGTAYGLYHGVIGFALFPASLIGGWLWATFSPAATFYFGSALAFIATLGIIVLMRK